MVKSGAAYVPIDPLYPSDRIEFMVADAAPKLLLTQQQARRGRAARTRTRSWLSTPQGRWTASPTTNPPQIHSGDDLAYVIFTSGSTGKPKGAMIAHRSLASAYFAYERAYRLRELHAHAQMASFSFDVFTGDMIRSLLVGAKLVLCPIETIVDPAALHALMLAEGIDIAEFVPATASLMFEWCEREGKTMDHMRLVVVSSEAWRNEQYAFVQAVLRAEHPSGQLLRPDRGDDRQHLVRARRRHRICCRGASCRSGGRSTTPGCTSSTRTSSRCRSGSRASCASAGCRSRAAT